jgi:hypothetical protein
VITILGLNPMTVLLNNTFTDPGATAIDACVGVVPIITNGTVDVTAIGNYTVTYTATDPSGNSATNTRTVNVTSNQPPIIVTQPSSLTTNASATVIFTVGTVGGDLNYQWLKNGVPLEDGTNISGSGTASLTLSNVLRADGGGYSVVVSNVFGFTNSAAAVLTVIDPVILTQPVALSVLAGHTNTFTVGAAGTPTLRYQWYSVIAGHTNKLAGKTNASLTLGPATTAMKGGYFVVVTNQLATPNSLTSTVAQLTVYLRPTITIITPRPSQIFYINLVHVTGKASDNVGLNSVWYQLNGGDWTQADGTTNWSATLTSLVAGVNTNVLRAYALDTGGNPSLTNTVKFTYVPSDRLVVQFNGPGTLSPNYSNALLQINKTYTMTATPTAGHVFSNWLGNASGSLTVLTNPARLTFVMQSNLMFQANIIPNPFLPVAGTYNGLFYDTNGVQQPSSGFFTLTLQTGGSYSAHLQMGNNRPSWSGRFTLAGAASAFISHPGTSNLSVTLALDLAPGVDRLTGSVSDGDWLASLWADRAIFDARKNPATNYAGSYTMIIPGHNDDEFFPEGDGYGPVTVDLSGNVRLAAGLLADNSSLSQNTTVSKDGRWPFYESLYAGSGSALSWITFTNQTDSDLHGAFSWIKPARTNDHFYPGGFTNVVMAEGFAYTPPTTNRVIALTNGFVIFSGGNLSMPFTNSIMLEQNNTIVAQGTNHLILSIVRPSGVLNGNVKFPGAANSTPFHAILLQGTNAAAGFFLGTDQSGRVLLEPQP